jgi:hypothetical protein
MIAAANAVIFAIIYLPMFTAPALQYGLPEIFDLPKHIGSIVSAALAEGWPAPNPYFPSAPFAYNLLFYLPLATIRRLVTGPGTVFALYAAATVWLAWLIPTLVNEVLVRLGRNVVERTSGVALITFVGGGLGLFHAWDLPIGYMASDAKLSVRYLDDPFTNLVLTPQHLFAVSCLLAAFLVVSHGAPSRSQIVVIAVVLLPAAMLTSFLLAPVSGLIALILTAPYLKAFCGSSGSALRERVSTCATPLIAAIAGAALTVPHLLQAWRWAGVEKATSIGLPDANWDVLALQAGPSLVFLIIGLFRLKGSWRDPRYTMFVLMWLSALVLWLLVQSPDASLKQDLAMRTFTAPLAALGFGWAWEMCGRRSAARSALVLFGCLLPASQVLLEIGYFAASARLPLAPPDRELLQSVHNTDARTVIFLPSPDQNLAALTERLVLMDFSGLNNDAYLPPEHREEVRRFFAAVAAPDTEPVVAAVRQSQMALVGAQAVDLSMAIKALCRDTLVVRTAADRQLLDFRGCTPDRGLSIERKLVASLQSLSWRTWGSLPPGAFAGQMESGHSKRLLVESPLLGDFGLIAPLQLNRGLYKVRALVSGRVDGPATGAAHLSLHGAKKIISIESGDYATGRELNAGLELKEDFTGGFIFGLGGWSNGRGRLELSELTIEKVGLN